MKRRHGLYVIPVLLLAALLAGCWGSDKSTSLELTQSGDVVATAAAVGIDKCHNCHANTAVNAVRIFDAWASSRHANLDNTYDNYDNSIGNSKPYHGTLPYSGYEPVPDGDCTPCHDPNGDSANLANYSGAGSSATLRWVIGCEACHGGGERHFGVGPIGGPSSGSFAVAASTGKSSQYNTCTKCHQETPTEHGSKPYRLISDTHFDNASRAVGSDIQGYVIRRAAGTACVDCHNPHSANMADSPNRQWKASAHGDFTGEGWKHYDWKQSNRASCQRCHTTTGVVNYLTSPSTYDPANNVFSWTSNVTTDNSSEMLYCYGCHTNYYGGLRNPGPITASYTGVTPEPVFPDVSGSNICVACHTGRENGDSVKASTANFANTGFINSHYLTAGATLFRVSGYEYGALSYANLAEFEHDMIGTPGGEGTGSNGPCVGCHMSATLNPADPGQGKHRFLPVGLDNTGSGQAVTTPVCAVCHDGVEAPVMNFAGLEASKDEALVGLSVLDNALRLRGFFFANTYPYFFKSADNTASANAVKNWTALAGGGFGDNTVGKNNMGAAFNYNLFAHDPGFFAHNHYYTKLLIYDAIDWLDDNLPNDSVQAYITATYGAGSPTETEALAYFGAAGRPTD